MNNNGRPLSNRKAVQLMIVLTLLAWATQTLFHQWGFGQVVAGADDEACAVAIVQRPSASLAIPTQSAAFGNATPQPIPQLAGPEQGAEKFVPALLGARSLARGTLVLRPDATVPAGEVKVKNVCRWSDADAGVFESVADLTVARVSPTKAFASVTSEQVRMTLRDAGMNLALVSISGATTCEVNRSDVQVDERAALQAWIDAHDAPAGTKADLEAKANDPADVQPVAGRALDDQPLADRTSNARPTGAPPSAAGPLPLAPVRRSRSLRELLAADLATRLQLDPEAVELTFNPADEKVLNLAEPYFKFNIAPRRGRDLGDVSWDVLIVSDGASQKASVSATARAWQTQSLLARPVSYQQVIREEDVQEKRTLVDRLPDEPLLARGQAVGQQASRDLKPGTLLTAHLVDPVQLAKPGQLITITVSQGTVKITTVARALEGGSYGQSVRARNDADPPQMFDVTLTGPQEGTVSSAPTPVVAAGN